MKAAVLEQIGKPLVVQGIQIPEVQDVQVLVRVLCAGICGAQIQEIDGRKGDSSHLPHMLGHEGSGIVERVGFGVTKVKKGDKVVIHWKKGWGSDPAPPIYNQTRPDVISERGAERSDGRQIKSGPCTTFSEYTVVSENRVTAIPSDVPDDLACLFGCCLSTALGVVENVARVQVSESVLVIGAGGVGLAMILACRLAGAMHIVSTDVITAKWKFAKDIGATRFFPAHWEDQFTVGDFDPEKPFGWARPIVGTAQFDVIIDTCGSLCRAALLKSGGRYILVGQPLPEMTLQPFTAGWIFQGNGGRVEATNGGGFNPTKDIPRYVDMWREGKLDDYEKIITHRLPLDRINEGIEIMREGKSGRVLIEMT